MSPKPPKLSDDPKRRLAEFQTEGEVNQRQKTRLHAKEQARFYVAYDFLAEILPPEFEFYRTLANVDMELMMSYKGLRSDDTRDMFKGAGDEDVLRVGNQAVDKHLRDQADGKRNR